MSAGAQFTARQRAVLGELGITLWRRPGKVHSDVPPIPGAGADDSPAVELRAPSARRPAAPAVEWDTLRAEVAACTRCALHRGRTQTVFGSGSTEAGWMIVGEAPGAEEDRQGEPFVGRSGQLLTEMLRAVGLAREAVFIANIVKCQPPGNRDPRNEEIEACASYLRRQVELLSPRLILAVGRVAAQSLLGVDTPVGRLRGRVHTHETTGTPVVVTYHPAYLLRSPVQKRKAWADLCLAAELAGSREAGS